MNTTPEEEIINRIKALHRETAISTEFKNSLAEKFYPDINLHDDE